MRISLSKSVALYVLAVCCSAKALAERSSAVAARSGEARSPEAFAPQGEGATLYDAACAQCHDAPAQGSRAPARDALRDRSPEAIVDALTGGAMRYQGLSLSGSERRAIAEYLTGKSFGGDITGAAQGRCSSVPPLRDATSAPAWNGWGPTLANTHFQPADAGGITAADVPRLSVKWAFGFPDTTSAWGQPSIVGGRLFVGSQNGTVYALDPKSGCVIWTFTAQGGVRASVSVGGGRAYFSDQKGWAYALDATTGRQIWSRKVEDHPL